MLGRRLGSAAIRQKAATTKPRVPRGLSESLGDEQTSMKRTLLAFAFMGACAPVDTAIPSDDSHFTAVFTSLDSLLSPSQRDTISRTPPDSMFLYYQTLGLYIRNHFGLWKGDTLYRYFHSLGIWHPDDMSDLALRAYGRHLSGERIDMVSIIAQRHHLPQPVVVPDDLPLVRSGGRARKP
jgi:hypothetical protein